ncbi:MAG: hypothetical protein V4456_14460 [Bacteroidota bacterium]|jgi:hypothetical protein|uniref:hypothetical protein n=1 Tax=Mucilaginibacter inviolabilis TaxID=2714892 RepID=UPI00140CB769|nr:hypothetical protein [Mucilaginibacter inviolabilis]NHA05881.1 hypothetical protein [Mucilaginibacter inviolabilis]
MESNHPLLEKLEELFGNEPFDPIEEELFKWFMFAYTGRGSGIKKLDRLNFELFKSKLNSLIDAIYQWQQDKK